MAAGADAAMPVSHDCRRWAELRADMDRMRIELLNAIRALSGAAPLAPAPA